MSATTDYSELLAQIEAVERRWRQGRTWQATSLARQIARRAAMAEDEDELRCVERMAERRAWGDWGPADDMQGYGWALLVDPEDAWDGGVSEHYSISS